MKTWIKYYRSVWVFAVFIGISSLPAEDRVIVVSSATELNENFDLAAIAEIFKEAENLQEFERLLNDPDIFLNNLDLNGDGQVDFIRVLEEEKDEGRLIVLQAIMGENAYADVAYIDILKEENGDIKMQIRGEASLYGERAYYIPSIYSVSGWPIIINLYDPFYDYYYSPFSWDYYPSWWSSYSCIRIGLYRAQIVYRYPYRSFRRAYQPYISRYYRPHHTSHREYDSIRRLNRRYSYDYRRDRSRDYIDSGYRTRDGRKDYSKKWNRYDRDDRNRDYSDRSYREKNTKKDKPEYRQGSSDRDREFKPDRKTEYIRENKRPPVSIPTFKETEKKDFKKRPPSNSSRYIAPPVSKKPEPKKRVYTPPSRSEPREPRKSYRRPEYSREKIQPPANSSYSRKSEKKALVKESSGSSSRYVAPPRSKKPEPKKRVYTPPAPKKEKTISKQPPPKKMKVSPPSRSETKKASKPRPKPRREK